MKKRIASIVALLLVFTMVLPLASCGKKEFVDDGKQYTYQDAVVTMPTNWNPHTYQTTDDAYPADFIRTGLYGFIFNDELNPVEGKDPYTGYKIIPEMAAEEPVDVTEKIKAEHPEFNIPASATKGYAYTIKLNKDATWEDGTKIDADTYVYSMQQLLNPQLLNYRATDYYAGNFSIAGAEFYANQGQTVTVSVNTVIANEKLADVDAFITAHADDKAWINWSYSFGFGYDFAKYPWDGTFKAEAKTADIANEVVETAITIKEMYDFYVKAVVASGYADEAGAKAWFLDEVSLQWTYPANVDYSTVGLYKSGDYEITLVLGKSLAGFNLLYNLSGNWIVYEPYYEACKKQEGDAWLSTYNTSVETTMSYGPYKLVSYQADKSMRFERNLAWYGYTDGKHEYKDPTDGKTYTMYQTDIIETEKVEEVATRKLMFLKGELMGYGLQAEDFEQYRSSKYAYVTPSETIFFFIFNGNKDAIENREKNESFDTTKNDLQTLTLTSFRKAFAVTYDKELLASTISPSRSGGYGLIGTAYIYDPESGSRYRDTDQAKKALCDFYSVDPTKFDSLDAAVDSITGYDPVTAKDLFTQAYNESITAGYITDADKDGKSDQVIRIEYCASAVTDFITKTIDYLNEKLSEVIKGTPFEGKIEIYASAPYGNEWSNKIKAGLSDIVLGGWSGSALDPFGLTDLYTNPSYQYDAAWFDASSVELELEVDVAGIEAAAPDMQKITMNLKQWSDSLNGATVTVDGKDYNFGDGIASVDTRLDILAAIETKVLGTYDYIPMLQDGSISLLSQQVYYVVEEYNPIMGRGGIAYMKYNYDDTEWAAYVASQPNGELSY